MLNTADANFPLLEPTPAYQAANGNANTAKLSTKARCPKLIPYHQHHQLDTTYTVSGKYTIAPANMSLAELRASFQNPGRQRRRIGDQKNNPFFKLNRTFRIDGEEKSKCPPIEA